MIVVTSVMLFMGESLLALLMLVGMWCLCAMFAARFSRSTLVRGRVRVVVDEKFLARWAFFQIYFVAMWSVLFKGVLYTTLRHSFAHVLLSKGQSLGIAIPAECLMLVMIALGGAGVLRYLSRRLTNEVDDDEVSVLEVDSGLS